MFDYGSKEAVYNGLEMRVPKLHKIIFLNKNTMGQFYGLIRKIFDLLSFGRLIQCNEMSFFSSSAICSTSNPIKLPN